MGGGSSEVVSVLGETLEVEENSELGEEGGDPIDMVDKVMLHLSLHFPIGALHGNAHSQIQLEHLIDIHIKGEETIANNRPHFKNSSTGFGFHSLNSALVSST